MNRSRFLSRSDSLIQLPAYDDLTEIVVQGGDDDHTNMTDDTNLRTARRDKTDATRIVPGQKQPGNGRKQTQKHSETGTNTKTSYKSRPHLYASSYVPDYAGSHTQNTKFLAYHTTPNRVRHDQDSPDHDLSGHDSPTNNVTSDMKLVYERGQTRKIIEDCKEKGISSRKRANLFRTLNLIITFFIILVSLGIGILETQKEIVYYTNVVMSFLVSIIETLHFIFRIGQRGIFFKYASLKYQKMLTIANDALFYSNNPTDLLRLNHQFRNDLDDLSYTSFKVSYGPESELRKGA